MAATLLLRNPPSYLGAASQQHSARNDRLTLGTVFYPAAGSATATPLAVTGGAVVGPAGTMGEVTLNSATQITINPARFVVPGGIDSKQGQYEAIHDQQDTMAVTAQDASLYRRSYLAVVVDDSETSGVTSSATTDRGSVQIIDGPLAASAPTYPSLTAYPNRLLLGEFYIPPTGQTVTFTPYSPRTALRSGILPVQGGAVVQPDGAPVSGWSGTSGVHDGQARAHPDRGLELWSTSGSSWVPQKGTPVSRVVGGSTTMTAADAFKQVHLSASASVFTIPTNAQVPLPVGTWVEVKNAIPAPSVIAAAPGSGVALLPALTGNGYLFCMVPDQHIRLTKTGTDTWQASNWIDTSWQHLNINGPLGEGADGAYVRLVNGWATANLHVAYGSSWASGFVVTTVPTWARPSRKHWFDALFFGNDQRYEMDVFPNGTISVARAVPTPTSGFVLTATWPVGV